jgi:hypothetical protein
MSYDDEHQIWSPFDRAQTATADLRFMLSMHASKDQVRTAIGPSNYARAFEYLDCVDKNLLVLQKHVDALIQVIEDLAPSALVDERVARARIEAGLVDHEETAQ